MQLYTITCKITIFLPKSLHNIITTNNCQQIFRYKKTISFILIVLNHIPSKLHTRNIIHLPITLLGHALDRLVTVSSMCYHTSTSVLSTSSSSRGLTTYVGISHLEGGFTLRCLQRLSRPGLATLP